MKNLIYIIFGVMLFSCQKKMSDNLPVPQNVTGISAEPRVGGALVKWTKPDSINTMYFEVSYMKKGKKVIQNVSAAEDSLLIQGLINKEEYTFTIQPFIRGLNDLVSGGTLSTSNSVRPIKRPINTVYFPNDITKVNVTDDMLLTYTQEPTEGPKKNLVDGDISTFWHTAWSTGVAPLPHWIQITFAQPEKIGIIKYYFRQNNSDNNGRPSQFGLDVSDDGATWTRAWTSDANLATDNPTAEKVLTLDANYTSKYFRVLILQNPGNRTYTHLGEISFYNMRSEVIDLEQQAESNY